MAMNRNAASIPNTMAFTPLSMLSWPRLGPTARSSTGDSGAASPPARSSRASSRPSIGLTPVIWKLLLNTPRTVDEHHGHQVAEVLLRVLQHLRGAPAVQAHRYGGAVLGIRLERRIGQLIAGDHHFALQQNRLLLTGVVELGPQGRSSRAHRFERVIGLVDHAEFQGRRLAQDLLDLGRVLQAGQLNGDPVHALPGDLRLRYREFRTIEAIAQDHDVLLNRVVLALLDLLRR